LPRSDAKLAHHHGIITKDVAQYALKALEVDEHGLDEMDKRLLHTIIEKYKGGPVGISTLAVAVGEEAGTIEEVYEPYPDPGRIPAAHPARSGSDRTCVCTSWQAEGHQ
jgi:Holliday junction resolvasome RuvABC ATP-dependent DNA helicase subunit